MARATNNTYLNHPLLYKAADTVTVPCPNIKM